jgi:RNase H-fold protein (predicted Holliday junction resolvase)
MTENHNQKSGKILGIDLGTKKTGLAYSDESQTLAFTWTVIEDDLEKQFDTLSNLILKKGFQHIVFGLPSQEGEWKSKIQAFALRLKSALNEHFTTSTSTPPPTSPLISFFDEDFSTFEAGQNLSEIKSTLGKKKRQKMDTSKDDAEAARIMLQRFLDQN